MSFKKICVLMGGTSNERDVSLVSGKNVVDALASLNKYDVIGLDVQSFFQVGQDPKTFVARFAAAVRSELCEKWPNITGLDEMTLPDALFVNTHFAAE